MITLSFEKCTNSKEICIQFDPYGRLPDSLVRESSKMTPFEIFGQSEFKRNPALRNFI